MIYSTHIYHIYNLFDDKLLVKIIIYDELTPGLFSETMKFWMLLYERF